MNKLRVVLIVLSALIAPVAASAAQPPPGADISRNLDYVQRVPGSEMIVEGKLDRVRGKQVLLTTGRYGFKSYDVSDPANPKAMDSFMPEGILGDKGYWQDEDMQVDTRRKLIIGALDPRHDDVDQTSCPGIGTSGTKNRLPGCRSGFYVISYANPKKLEQVGPFVDVPSGHTSTCIDGCRYIWTGGPARRSDLPARFPGVFTAFTEGGRGDGRPIWVTDLRDPENPSTYTKPVDLWRNDGATDYSHDVNVDDEGVAWTAGRGGILGYATRGNHRDPFTGRWRKATPWNPVLVAGGGLDGANQPQAMFMHNSLRPTDGSTRARGVKKGNVLIGTEEDFTEPCDKSGRVVFSDLTGSEGGRRAAGSTPQNPYRMKALDTFHPAQDGGENIDTSLGCSAHYFELQDSTLGVAWYGQGLRLLDVSNARDVRQIGYYRVTGTDATANPSSLSWDLAYNGRYVYLFDMNRGIEVLKLKKGSGAKAAAASRSVRAPDQRRDRLAARPVADRGGSYICPVFR